jgi:Flp pilus assembly protein TadD
MEIGDVYDSETLKKNYYRLAKEFHPDRYFSSTDSSIKMKLTSIFDALTKAYDGLKSEGKSSEEYFRSARGANRGEDAEGQSKAVELYRDGIAEFKKGNFWGAIDKFKGATNVAPQKAAYWSYLSLAYSKVPGRVKDAEEALLAALKLEPFSAELHSNLGLIYMKAGLKKRAHSVFQKAVTIDPGNEKAQKGLEQTKK